MDCIQPPANKPYLTTLCGIVAAMWLIVFVGCQGVTEPSSTQHPDNVNGSLSGVQTASVLLFDVGPALTVTNEYMDSVEWPRVGAIIKIPNGIPLTFCWTAEEAMGGGAIEAYRYGWDVIDPDDPAQWEMDFTPYDGSKFCAPSRSFNAWGFHLFTVEVIDDAGANSRVAIVIEIVMGPVSFDVMPGSCKNPLNVQKKSQIKTAIPGRVGLDVSEIDVSSLYLWIDGNIVEPLGTRVKDTTSPMINRAPCDCPPTNADGIDDLEILFAATDIIRAMGSVSKDEIRQLAIRGVLLDGYDFSLTDCVTIVGNPRTGDEPALFQRDAVLVALSKGYNEKDYQKVSALFDDDFTFFFADEDIQSGNVPVSQWGRDDELIATANLFNVDASVDAPSDASADAIVLGSIRDRIRHAGATEEATWGLAKSAFFDGAINGQTAIGLILIYAQGEDNWIGVLPPDPAQYPGEVWYEKTATYYLYVQASDFAFITNTMLQTSFVVRFSETKDSWQLAQWRDDT